MAFLVLLERLSLSSAQFPPPRRLRVRLRRDRGDRRKERGELSPARAPRAPPYRVREAALRDVTGGAGKACGTVPRGCRRGRRRRRRGAARRGRRRVRRRRGQGAAMVEADRRQMPELGVIVEARQVNGQPVAVFLDPDGSIVTVWSLDIADWLVQTVRSAIDPDKLRHLG